MKGRNERRAGFIYVTEEAGAQGEGESSREEFRTKDRVFEAPAVRRDWELPRKC